MTKEQTSAFTPEESKFIVGFAMSYGGLLEKPEIQQCMQSSSS